MVLLDLDLARFLLKYHLRFCDSLSLSPPPRHPHQPPTHELLHLSCSEHKSSGLVENDCTVEANRSHRPSSIIGGGGVRLTPQYEGLFVDMIPAEDEGE